MTNRSDTQEPNWPPAGMTELYFGLLKKGPTWTADVDEQIKSDQCAHLNHL
ncbi:MAG: hypothetical protein WBR18_15870 [Anaerolineales bacterium]